MKLKEKLAENFTSKLEKSYDTDIIAYIAGFTAAKKLLLKKLSAYRIMKILTRHDIETLGEEEVEG